MFPGETRATAAAAVPRGGARAEPPPGCLVGDILGESAALPRWGEAQRSRFTAAAPLGLARAVPEKPGAADLRGAVDGRFVLHDAVETMLSGEACGGCGTRGLR